MKVVRIVWFDSKGVTSEWEFKDEMEPMLPVVISSVGYLYSDHEKYKTIVQSKGDDQVVGRMTIPMGCIEKITILSDEVPAASERNGG